MNSSTAISIEQFSGDPELLTPLAHNVAESTGNDVDNYIVEIRQAIAGRQIFVASIGNKPVGMSLVRTVPVNVATVEIGQVSVLPEARGQRISQQLLDEMLRTLQHESCMYVPITNVLIHTRSNSLKQWAASASFSLLDTDSYLSYWQNDMPTCERKRKNRQADPNWTAWHKDIQNNIFDKK